MDILQRKLGTNHIYLHDTHKHTLKVPLARRNMKQKYIEMKIKKIIKSIEGLNVMVWRYIPNDYEIMREKHKSIQVLIYNYYVNAKINILYPFVFSFLGVHPFKIKMYEYVWINSL